MGYIDVNCQIGNWPFRRLYKNTFEDLKRIHRENNIYTGYVSSLNSIFYNDPYEGDEELHEIIKGSDYYHVLTINPMLPEFTVDIEKGVKEFDIKGIKIYPGYHGYNLDNINLLALSDFLEIYGLPLFIVVRMEDERLNNLFHPRTLTCQEIIEFINRKKGIKKIILNANVYEIMEIQKGIAEKSNVFFDTSGLKGPLFSIEKLLEIVSPENILYGSMYPLYCLKSSLLQIKKSEVKEEDKIKMLNRNANELNR